MISATITWRSWQRFKYFVSLSHCLLLSLFLFLSHFLSSGIWFKTISSLRKEKIYVEISKYSVRKRHIGRRGERKGESNVSVGVLSSISLLSLFFHSFSSLSLSSFILSLLSLSSFILSLLSLSSFILSLLSLSLLSFFLSLLSFFLSLLSLLPFEAVFVSI